MRFIDKIDDVGGWAATSSNEDFSRITRLTRAMRDAPNGIEAFALLGEYRYAVRLEALAELSAETD